MSSTANTLLGNPLVKDLLICTLCSRFFNDPRVLPCQHTFCLSCLQKQFQTSHASSRVRLSSIRCPTCFSSAAIPIRGIHNFPTDHKVEKVKELVDGVMMTGILKKSRIENLEGRPRSGSKSRPSSWTGDINVLDGNGYDDLHNTSHGSLDDMNIENIVPHLPKETREVSTSTSDNDPSPIENSSNFQDCGIQTDISGDLTINIEHEKTSSKHGDFAGNEIQDSTDSSGARKRVRDNNVNKLNYNGVSHNKRTCTDSESSNNNNTDPNLNENNIGSSNGIRNEGNGHNSDESYLDGQRFQQAKSKAEENSMDTTYYEENDVTQKTQTNGNSTVTDEVDGGVNGEVNLEQQEDHLSPVFTGDSKLLWTVEKEEFDMPTSVAMTSNGNIIVSEYGNCKLQFYEPSGHYIQSIDEIKPFALAVNKEDNIVVADRKDKTIKVFDTLGELSYKWDSNCFHWISGIGITSQGNFVVFDREDCKIGIFTPEGERIHQFGHYGDGDSHLCMADFLAVDAHDRILVCDSGHHCVKVYDINGTFLGRFGERGTSEGYLLWPKSVSVDGSNNILVSDQRNNRISLYSPEGHFIQTVVNTTISPFNIGFNQPNTLAITSFSLTGHSEINVYQL